MKPSKPQKQSHPNKSSGFSYALSREQIEEYRTWTMERRLKWLFCANKIRRFLPRKTIELQEAFRQGKM